LSPRRTRPRRPPEPVAVPPPAPPAGAARLWPWLAVGLVLLFVVAVRARLLDVPLERDEGEYAYAGQLMLRGIPPYQLVYNMKLPGAYVVYALFLALFGQTARAIHLGLLLVNGATVVLLFLLGRRWLGAFAGVVAAAAYALFSMGRAVEGPFAHSSHLVVLAALAGVLLLWRAFDSGRGRDYFWSGLCLGLSLLMKQHGVFFLLFGVLALVARGRRRGAGAQGLAGSGPPFALGAALPLLVTGIVLALAGVFPAFWFWTFRYAAAYVSEVPFSAGMVYLRDSLTRIVTADPLLWGTSLLGLVVLLGAGRSGPRRATILAFTGSAFLAVCPGLYFREHYFVLLLPAAALLVAVAVDGLRRLLAGTGARSGAGPLAATAFLAVFLVSLGMQAGYLLRATPRQVCRMTYGLNPFPEAREIARYISAHSSPGDRIAVLGSEPEILFYANRLSATGHIYMYGLMEPQPYARTMQLQAIQEIEKSAPAWLVFVNSPYSWVIRPDSDRTLLAWYARYVEEHYVPAGLIETFSRETTAYTWSDTVSVRDTRTRDLIMVYRRKPPA
jgi:hypothetical protein